MRKCAYQRRIGSPRVGEDAAPSISPPQGSQNYGDPIAAAQTLFVHDVAERIGGRSGVTAVAPVYPGGVIPDKRGPVPFAERATRRRYCVSLFLPWLPMVGTVVQLGRRSTR